MIKRMQGVAVAGMLCINLSLAHPADPSQAGETKGAQNENSAFLKRGSLQLVHWYPLGPDAWAKSQQTKKPLLIEVGAIWCPYCEAMDKDGYGNAAIADYINDHFVAVCIDYDTDPELSHKLELAQALANLPSGMPLTMFVTPEGKLFEGGGYFPPSPAKYKPSFSEFLHRASEEFASKSFRVEPRDIRAELKLAKADGK